MALIPKKTTTSVLGDSGLGLELLMIMFGVVVLGETTLEKYVNKKLSILLLCVLIMIVAYMILPSRINHGQCGYMRILIWLKYRFEKIKERLAKS